MRTVLLGTALVWVLGFTLTACETETSVKDGAPTTADLEKTVKEGLNPRRSLRSG